MKTITEHIRERLLSGVVQHHYSLPGLRVSEWSYEFESLMRNRLLVGTFRYGALHSKPPGVKYSRIGSALTRLQLYITTGNLEHLVDVANLCLLEFEEGDRPKRHLHSHDDGPHHTERR